ncbi:hypothetical protein SLEP1_g6681 [Rubroshorea leprosula]|uniref:Secreted protein n=1 Tax=Rubroshorea leprosula TaxID=152421 RepID=A0AAV5I4Y3_9ROSI|nr:hypothetical protein SLEP1_g6681 [Rubroshorea leprosula]
MPQSRHLFLLLCSHIFLFFLCVTFPLLCATEFCFWVCRERTRRKAVARQSTKKKERRGDARRGVGEIMKGKKVRWGCCNDHLSDFIIFTDHLQTATPSTQNHRKPLVFLL